MKWKVRKSVLKGTIMIPSSKSHTIRALLIATLAEGNSVIRNPLLKGDGASAIGAARSFGAQIEQHGTRLHVQGVGNNYNLGNDLFDMGNSGTSTNLFASAVALGSRPRRFDGDQSLRSRPVKHLLEALKQLGASYSFDSTDRDLPFTINGPLHGGFARVNGMSSQYVSSLLITCPLLTGNTEIEIVDLHEKPYVELTLWWLKNQGIEMHYSADLSHFTIPGGQKYKAFDLAVPADFSSATFSAVAAVLSSTCLILTGLDFSDPQGDKGVFDIIRKAGGKTLQTHGSATVCGGQLKGCTIDLNSMPDALPALSVLACASKGTTEIINVAQARIKETDRIKVMTEELTKMGASIEERPDGLVIHESTLHGATVNGHDDHRVVMSLALAGLIADGETIIETAEAAEVTYPSFVEDFKNLGADIEVIPD